jgi:hypothetical protein
LVFLGVTNTNMQQNQRRRRSFQFRPSIEAYWTPMKEIFARGALSDETRARVATDRTERIAKGRFRRKLSTAP